MAADVVFECDSTDIDVRVNAGIGVLVIATEEGRAIASASEDVLEKLALRIRLELDGARRRPGQAPGQTFSENRRALRRRGRRYRPWRLCLSWNARMARRKSTLRKAGQLRSQK